VPTTPEVRSATDGDDLLCYLDKWEETIRWAYEFFTKQSESYAAQHVNEKVFYSPICNRLAEALQDIEMVREKVKA
jgi:hypothetical protein